MPSLITPMAGRRNVCHVIAASVALCLKVFCGALQQSRRA
jgi:hypothetical protein